MSDKDEDIRIVVFHRGWVGVGRYSATLDEVVLEDCADVRKWGTRDKGLGWIAKNGPTQETILDPSTTQRTHPLLVIKTYDCVPEKWVGVLDGLWK